MSATPISSVWIAVGDAVVTDSVIWSKSTFTSAASAQPGTCQIVLRGSNWGGLRNGDVIKLRINDALVWQGYLFTIEQGYVFADDPEPQWTLSGVDLNILFDKLILYNHAHPTWRLDGNGTYRREKTGGGYVVAVPKGTSDRDYIWAMVGKYRSGFTPVEGDTDIGLVNPPINTISRVGEIGTINPDATFTPPDAGLTLRSFMIDVSRNVQRSTPGSAIWYIDPAGRLVYQEADTNRGPNVGDDESTGINVRNLRVTTDISRIKNDVLVFSGNLDPRATSTQENLLYSHKQSTPSVNRYGRFQYSEVLSSDWLQSAVTARANKLIYQEGLPAMRAEFTTYESGFYPGQIISIHSTYHTFRYYDPVLGDVATHTVNIPIRSISMNFVTKRIVEYGVVCSYDTQDPWGLLLALRQPPGRGLVQPRFSVIDRTKSPPDPLMGSAPVYTFVREYPQSMSSNRYQCSYGYIRYSLTVYVDGLRKVGVPEGGSGTVGFLETSPSTGVFQLGFTPTAGQEVYVEYHVAQNLTT